MLATAYGRAVRRPASLMMRSMHSDKQIGSDDRAAATVLTGLLGKKLVSGLARHAKINPETDAI